MSKKRYEVKGACPQCGCSFATHCPRELKARYGDVPNIELECGECMLNIPNPWKRLALNGTRNVN